jgi:multiple sugar transport system permease protein/putative aldouronate transport system permease protein
MRSSSHKIHISRGDRTFYFLINTGLTLILLVVLYPLLYVLSSSFSSPAAVLSGRVVLWPVDFSLDGYTTVFKNRDVFIGYYNSFRYMIMGTTINVAATMIAAYPLSRKDTPFRNLWMFLFTFTMFFGGGLIPNYMLMMDLKLIDTAWVMMIPGAISVWNMIIARTFIQHSIPGELLEAAEIDGCSDARYFFVMVLPLSKAVIAVIALYYAVGHWNAYFDALIYLNRRTLYPLQLFLREILVINTFDPAFIIDPELMVKKQGLADLLKYSLIIVATVPMLIIYPFAQRYFIKGVMIGSLKG